MYLYMYNVWISTSKQVSKHLGVKKKKKTNNVSNVSNVHLNTSSHFICIKNMKVALLLYRIETFFFFYFFFYELLLSWQKNPTNQRTNHCLVPAI